MSDMAINQLWATQQSKLEEKDTEIERLLTKLDKQTTEIERLKAEVKDLLEQNAEWQKALVEAVEKRDKLITELS